MNEINSYDIEIAIMMKTKNRIITNLQHNFGYLLWSQKGVRILDQNILSIFSIFVSDILF